VAINFFEYRQIQQFQRFEQKKSNRFRGCEHKLQFFAAFVLKRERKKFVLKRKKIGIFKFDWEAENNGSATLRLPRMENKRLRSSSSSAGRTRRRNSYF
jgi:outer membrane phospholipase A